MTCSQCGRAIGSDEIGLTRKLVNRGATRFLCYECLGRTFRLSRGQLDDLAERFRAAGCTLFGAREENNRQ